jgi:hypothetical protein
VTVPLKMDAVRRSSREQKKCKNHVPEHYYKKDVKYIVRFQAIRFVKVVTREFVVNVTVYEGCLKYHFRKKEKKEQGPLHTGKRVDLDRVQVPRPPDQLGACPGCGGGCC